MLPASATEVRVVDVDVFGNTVLVVYRPIGVWLASITPDLDAAELLCVAVDSWDLEDDDGQVIPIVDTALASVPIPVLTVIAAAVAADAKAR